jgi:hypothetical protein
MLGYLFDGVVVVARTGTAACDRLGSAPPCTSRRSASTIAAAAYP